MAFTVEDGTGVVGANAYATAAWVAEYHADRGNSDFVNKDVEPLIIRATDYIEWNFAAEFSGHRTTQEQGLSWPRRGAVMDRYVWLADDVVPEPLMAATAILTLSAQCNELLPDQLDGVETSGAERAGSLSVQIARGAEGRVPHWASALLQLRRIVGSRGPLRR